MLVQSLDWEYPLEEGMAFQSSILVWGIPQTEDPGGLQSTESQRVYGHSIIQQISDFRATYLESMWEFVVL